MERDDTRLVQTACLEIQTRWSLPSSPPTGEMPMPSPLS